MIIEFSITNFRSIKEKQIFSLVAETTKSKRETNTFEVDGPGRVRLLKSAVVYGSNASGKSNFISAFGNFTALIVNSGKFEAKESILMYDPFLFDIQTFEAATEYECTFIANDNIKHEYKYRLLAFMLSMKN